MGYAGPRLSTLELATPRAVASVTRGTKRDRMTIHTEDIERPSKKLVESLYEVSSAVAAGELSRLGIRDPYILGPACRTPEAKVAGPTLTLQFMPQREDQYAADE